jgi:hypothetical protein
MSIKRSLELLVKTLKDPHHLPYSYNNLYENKDGQVIEWKQNHQRIKMDRLQTSKWRSQPITNKSHQRKSKTATTMRRRRWWEQPKRVLELSQFHKHRTTSRHVIPRTEPRWKRRTTVSKPTATVVSLCD